MYLLWLINYEIKHDLIFSYDSPLYNDYVNRWSVVGTQSYTTGVIWQGCNVISCCWSDCYCWVFRYITAEYHSVDTSWVWLRYTHWISEFVGNESWECLLYARHAVTMVLSILHKQLVIHYYVGYSNVCNNITNKCGQVQWNYLFIVNLQYISVNTKIWYMHLLQYNIYSYSSYMFRLIWVIFRH